MNIMVQPASLDMQGGPPLVLIDQSDWRRALGREGKKKKKEKVRRRKEERLARKGASPG
jgi:hypothetical protein